MSTTLIAIRHAKPLSEGFADERLRPLHKEGISTQEMIVQRLAEKGYMPERIFSSPILRAVQTAAIIAKHFSLEVEEEEALGYNFNQSILLANLLQANQGRTIIFVGHAPHLAEFVNDLTGYPALMHGLSKSEAAILRFNQEIELGKATFLDNLKL